MSRPATGQIIEHTGSVQRDPERMPTFHEFAAEWWTLHEHEWAPKTVADYRWGLEEHLLQHFADTPLDAIDYAVSATKIGSRIPVPASEAANVKLTEHGLPPLPRLTPHSLRRTFASVLFALGETPPTVMAVLGHTDAAFTLSIYARAMRRSDCEKAKLRALVDGVWADECADERANASDFASESQL